MNLLIFIDLNLFIIILTDVQMIKLVFGQWKRVLDFSLPCESDREERGQNRRRLSPFPVRRATGSFVEIALSLQVSLGRTDITTVSLPVCEWYTALFTAASATALH